MKVLEIKRFMPFAKDYEGEHELLRWGIASIEQNQKGMLGALWAGWRMIAKAPGLEIDAIVCHSFGNAYGSRRGGRFYRWRHRAKALYERMLVRMVLLMTRRSGAPLAVIDISDDPTIHMINRPLLDAATCYFKRELPLDPYQAFESLRGGATRAATLVDRKRPDWNRWVAKLRPLSLGCAAVEPDPGELPERCEKKWDVFYVGDELYKPRRDGIKEELEALAAEGIRVFAPSEPLPIETYLEELSRARLALSPPGLGWDCHRTYEAALLGTVPVTPFPIIRRHAPFLDGEHCLLYDPEKSLSLQLSEMLRQRENLSKIASAARQHALRHHTHERLFDYVIRATTESARSGLN